MKNILTYLVLPCITVACASPQIYIIDRQTRMESEAGGAWPEAEEQLLEVVQRAGPTFYKENQDVHKQKRLQNILNAELGE